MSQNTQQITSNIGGASTFSASQSSSNQTANHAFQNVIEPNLQDVIRQPNHLNVSSCSGVSPTISNAVNNVENQETMQGPSTREGRNNDETLLNSSINNFSSLRNQNFCMFTYQKKNIEYNYDSGEGSSKYGNIKNHRCKHNISKQPVNQTNFKEPTFLPSFATSNSIIRPINVSNKSQLGQSLFMSIPSRKVHRNVNALPIRNSNSSYTLSNQCSHQRSSGLSNDDELRVKSANVCGGGFNCVNHILNGMCFFASSTFSSNLHSCHINCRCHRNHSCETVGNRIDSEIPIYPFQQCLSDQMRSASLNESNSACNINTKSFGLRMTPIEATTIISSHCNTPNNISFRNNSNAITKLSSSSSGFPVTALTVMESPKINSSRKASYNWQAFTSNIKDRMATIFNCELLADVHFIVGKNSDITRFPAHKFVLSIGSAVFDAMFNGALTKANELKNKLEHESTVSSANNIETQIELPDVEPEAFKTLLRFLYLDEIQIGPDNVLATLYVAKKYEVTTLEVACVDFLKSNINIENAFMILAQARLYDESTLADQCLDTIDKHTNEALRSESFFEIDLNTLKDVLSRDSLRVRELSLFIAILRWSEHECTRRSLDVNPFHKRLVLNDAMYLIRFPLMTIEDFANNVAQSGILSDNEVVNVFLYYLLESKPTLPFPIEPRCCITGEECTVKRFQRTDCRWGYSGTSDRIRFVTDRSIFVIGFGLFGSIKGSSEYTAKIEILHTASGKILASNIVTFISDGTDSTFRVLFNYPVEIIPNTNYTACATLKGVDSYYGIGGFRTVSVNIGKESKEAVIFQFSYSAGCNNGTSVEDGQIPEIIFYT